MSQELTYQQLRKVCDPETLKTTTSVDQKASKAIIGQERAARSLKFGLGIQALGFNIYVAGLPGTGRKTMVEHFLEQVAKDKPSPLDRCYVNNMRDASRPQVISLPAGQGRQFQSDMKNLVDSAQEELHKAFDSAEYTARRNETTSSYDQQVKDIIAGINAKAQQEGFAIQETPMGFMTVPVRWGHPMTQTEYMLLRQSDKDTISQKQEELQKEIETAVRQAKTLDKTAGDELKKMDRQIALYALSHIFDDMKGKYQGLPEVLAYLDKVQEDILEHLDDFRADPTNQQNVLFRLQDIQGQLQRRYAVNVLVDNGDLKGAPVVMEPNPTYSNLFGRVENEAHFGALITDFTLIRQGALHRANGGYLVLPVEEVLRSSYSWEALKRALRNQHIVIEDPGELVGYMTTRTLQPEPIPLEVKIILIGQPDLYQLLRNYDEDFSELFKVKADFTSEMDRTEESVGDYAILVNQVCAEDQLNPVDNSALARIVEHGSRLAEDQTKLSTCFGEIADVIREANYYAALEKSSTVTAAHIEKAIDEKVYRSNQIRERLNEMIADETLKIDVQGECAGQINGLSVLDLGDISIGQPSRITVSTGVGREGLIDIEREAKLGGPTHTKGVLILSGYLMEKFAQDKPLSLSARLVFEQSYSGVDGDSASSTELYAILSELSGLPIHQGIAVTGSVNQKGEVQAIGGVNEKIEGFYEVCKVKGLTGKQGVMIPQSNVQNLMLKEEVVDAVRDGQFHIWSVKTVDEGIEHLTGMKAGQRTADGKFEEGSVNERVNQRLEELSKIFIKLSSDGQEKSKVEG